MQHDPKFSHGALLILAILEDDFSRVDRKSILETIRASQKENGSFFSQGPGSESDMRYVFCAAAICHILGDDEAIDWNRTGAFIHSAMSFDGGIGQGPHDESHGGSTYCAVASLALANRLWDYSVFSEKEIRKLIKWALWKQGEGFHGRAHKDDDSCYAFWIGATLQILNAYEFIDQERLRSFLYRAQHDMLGGFKKILAEHQVSDLLHTFFSIAALSLLREPQLNPLNSSLNVSRRAYEHIGRLRRHFQ